MFASIRRYRIHHGTMEELIRRVDEGFADLIAGQAGFASYEFLDCGDGEVMTVSLFEGVDQAEASRDLARRWTDENLTDFEFARLEALTGEVLVSRADREMLAPGHAGAGERFASVRRYRLRSGSLAELMHRVDERFADSLGEIDGFEAYHALSCPHDEVMSISLFRDQAAAEESDERALEFARDELADFDVERTDVIGGAIAVSRATEQVLEPAHA